jgi:dipeptidyl aminopeptidase/acylaminoacyl peptidase
MHNGHFATGLDKSRMKHLGGMMRLLCLAALLAGGAGRVWGADNPAEADRGRSLRRMTENKVFRDRVQPHWLAGNNQFWYQVKTGPETDEFVLVDAEKGQRRAAFDHARLAKALLEAGIKNARADRLPIDQLAFKLNENAATFRAGNKFWRCDLATYRLTSQDKGAGDDALSSLPNLARPRPSTRTGPETSLVFVNRTQGPVELFWMDTEGQRRSYGKLRPGEQREQHTFAGHVWLAQDAQGQTVGVFEADENGGTAEIGIAPTTRPAGMRGGLRQRRGGLSSTTSPDGQWRAFVKDNNLGIRKAEGGQEVMLSSDGSAGDAYSERVYWSPDSKKLVAMRTKEGQEHKVYLVESSPADQVQPKLVTLDYLKPGDRIAITKPHLFDIEAKKQIAVSDALFANPWSIGDVRWWPDSSRFTFLFNQRGHQALRIIAVDAQSGQARPIVDEQSKTFIDYSGKMFVEYLDDSGEIIWMSERDGWNHLYRYDAKTGEVKNQITKGQWVVRGVERVDRQKRQIWFRAGGIRPGQDPYYIHYARVNFDGTGLTVLTEGDGTHTIQYSPDGRYFLDSYSRVDMPPVNELRRTDTGSLVCALEKADWSALLAAGWRAPERFVAKGRDGITDIYGVIVRPMNFDAGRKYPVIENIYAGPQSSFVPKSFSTMGRMQELAELGFIVVQIDGMGTSNRSKPFHDVCWKNLGDAGFPDRILWIKAAGAKYPSMDLARVGIYGTSAGGQSALGGLLTHGDFYRAGVADCGCHDNRMDKIWWNEQWMGWPVGPEYAAQSNVTLAPRLEGKLLLMVGEMDRNVDPASTMQVVNALIKANKDFELLVMPGQGHGVAGTPYGWRRLTDFFVRNLLDSAR